MFVTPEDLISLAAKAGGCVIGLIVLFWTRKIVRGIK